MPLAADTMAPDFDLADQFGAHVRLSDFREVKPVALVFFPLAFSSTCTSELGVLRDNRALFEANDIELIGVSVDSKATMRAFAEVEGYDFTLLADFWPHGQVGSEYGVFLEQKGFSTRATFFIDIVGVIRASVVTEPGTPRVLEDYVRAMATLQSRIRRS